MCKTCSAPLAAPVVYRCNACDDTAPAIVARHERVEWLECSHQAHAECLAQWIGSCDERGCEPTCLECEKVLSDAAIGLLLGADEHAKRAERLVERLGYVSCPTPGCAMRFELEDGVDKRTTTCPRCDCAVCVGVISLDELRGLAGAEAEATAAAPAAADAVIDLTSEDEEEAAAVKEKAAADAAAAQEQQELLQKSSIKQCPGCRQAVTKDPKSCDKFKCICGTKFCWRCDQRADERGELSCRCTGRNHVYWDNQTNRAEVPRRHRSPGAAGGAKRQRR